MNNLVKNMADLWDLFGFLARDRFRVLMARSVGWNPLAPKPTTKPGFLGHWYKPLTLLSIAVQPSTDLRTKQSFITEQSTHHWVKYLAGLQTVQMKTISKFKPKGIACTRRRRSWGLCTPDRCRPPEGRPGSQRVIFCTSNFPNSHNFGGPGSCKWPRQIE